MKIESESDKRLIVKGKVGTKEAYFLVDTGASIGLIASDRKRTYGLIQGKPFKGKIIGGSGNAIDTSYVCDNIVEVGCKLINQFVLADISGIRESIKRETKIEILGLIGLSQMKAVGVSIDLRNNCLEI